MKKGKYAGIYCITINRGDLSPMHYIGQSINISNRCKGHLFSLRKGNHFNVRLQRAFNKYGESSATFLPLIICEPKADILQMYEQAVVDSMDPNSIFNIRLECVVSSLGIPASQERKERMAIAITGIKRSLDTRERVARAQAWKKTPEGRARLSAQQTGKKATELTKKKMRLAHLARHQGKNVLKYGSAWILHGGG